MATVSDCAAHLFITERRFYELLGEGVIDRQPTNGYDLDLVREQYIEHIRGVASGRGTNEGNPDLTKERTRLAKEQADGQAMRNAVTRGALVSIEDVGRVVEAEYATIRANFTSMPGDIAADLEGLDAAEAEELLANKVAEILNELAADTKFASEEALDPGEDEGVAPTAPPEFD